MCHNLANGEVEGHLKAVGSAVLHSEPCVCYEQRLFVVGSGPLLLCYDLIAPRLQQHFSVTTGRVHCCPHTSFTAALVLRHLYRSTFTAALVLQHLYRSTCTAAVQAGNEAVLRARFEDAQFFYQADLDKRLEDFR